MYNPSNKMSSINSPTPSLSENWGPHIFYYTQFAPKLFPSLEHDTEEFYLNRLLTDIATKRPVVNTNFINPTLHLVSEPVVTNTPARSPLTIQLRLNRN